MDLNGKILTTEQLNLSIEPLKGKSYFSVPVGELLKGRDDRNAVLAAELKTGGKTISTNEYFFKTFKEMRFAPPEITAEVIPSEKGFKITLSSEKVAKAVFLSGLNEEGVFEDNYFNLIPGKKKEIEFRANGKMQTDEFRRKLRFRSLVDAF